MIRQTLRGLRCMANAVWPVAALAAPPIAGALLLEYVMWLGILILCLTAVGFVLVVAHTIGQYEEQQ